MIARLGEREPQLDAGAWVAPGAIIIGSVSIGAASSVWYRAVLRADDEAVRIGSSSNLQDGCVLHADAGYPIEVGDRVTVGHGATLHGCAVEPDCLIGVGAIILNGARLGSGSLVGAGALVPEGRVVPPNSLVLGAPARIKRSTATEEHNLIEDSWREYVEKADRHRRLLDPT